MLSREMAGSDLNLAGLVENGLRGKLGVAGGS